MALRISYCPYRLLFTHPFGTAHGLRDGTDSVFIRVEEGGSCGYGEVTLPPYLTQTVQEAIQRIARIAARGEVHAGQLLSRLDALPELAGNASGCRAGLSTALIDLISKRTQWSVRKMLEVNERSAPLTLVTLGISALEEIPSKLRELPQSDALKVKVGDTEAASRINAIRALDNRQLFLDGNQGMRSIEEATAMISAVGIERSLGIEQPFDAVGDNLSRELGQLTGVTVFADESIQNMDDLRAKYASYGGVNLKLMKCGGLDRAKAMMDRARVLGLKVMLGSMSESSLGCTAMSQLAGEADLVDLDGPWLIKNDPFAGISMQEGRLVVPEGPGLGTTLIADLAFTPFGA